MLNNCICIYLSSISREHYLLHFFLGGGGGRSRLMSQVWNFSVTNYIFMHINERSHFKIIPQAGQESHFTS